MTAKNNIIKSISALLIISIILPTVLFSKPKQVSAQWAVTDIPHTAVSTVNGVFQGTTATSTVTNTGISIKNVAIEIGKQLLKVAAKRVLAKMTQATINWINSGFHGSPLFLENPESFFQDIAKSEIKSLVDLIGYDTFRFPFGKQTALQVISSYKRQLSDNAQYTLSKVINDPDLLVRYRNDFNVGGWNGFLINTQYPQNNYLGFNMIIQQNLASRLEGTLMTPAQKVKDTLQQGMGFLSPKICADPNTKYNNGVNEFLRPTFKSAPFDPNDPKYSGPSGSLRWTEENNKAKAEFDKNNTCPGGLVSTTPGSVAANQVFSAMNTPFLTTALDGALGNSLAAIFDALINKFIDDGLTSLASTVNQGPREDNWSYNGNTLGGTTTTTTGGAGPLNIPQNVSVRVGEITSTTISGGTGIYSIKTPSDTRKATATISVAGASGSRLTVTGVAPGTTSVVIKDSSTSCPTQSSPTPCAVTVTITTTASGDLDASPANASAGINNPLIATISGGTEPYFIKIASNETVAITIISGANLVITGVAKGSTLVAVEDSSFPTKKSVSIPITINGPDELIIKQNASVKVGEVSILPISGGLAPFIIMSQQDVTVATAEIPPANPNIFTITGKVPGSSVVVVADSSSPQKITTVSITTLAPLGNCHKRLGRVDGDEIAVDTPNMTKAQCEDSIGGKWTQNTTP